ncbi:MAG TPA: alkaline phosphatase family protein [Candidatus Nanoarchaeia archaeon]|nr:alkaline phosphatase family protein [Candidatus Nanoarchaeia archaeon]
MNCIFIDAFNPRYLKWTSYLKELSKENLHGNLEVTFGYTSIIASLVSGFYPEKHGVIDTFTLRKKPGFHIKNKYIASLARLMTKNLFLYSPLQHEAAKYFEPSLKKIWPQKNSLKVPTIFDTLEKKNKSFTFLDWPFIFNNRKASLFVQKSTEATLRKAKTLKADFNWIHFLELDDIGHEHGIYSNVTKDAVRRIDEACQELDTKKMLFFSDHSMDMIEKRYDLEKELIDLNLTYGKDFIYFIGSTFIRFWFKNSFAEAKVEDLLKGIKAGKIVDFKEYKLPKECDLIFLANKGTVFYPNFFGKEQKAQHGWDPKQQKTFYMVKGLKGKKEIHVVDLMKKALPLVK